MDAHTLFMWLLCFTVCSIVNTSGMPLPDSSEFDGIIRATSDGRGEAYLIPPFKSNHASNIEIVPNKAKMGVNLMVAWFSGTEEGASDVAIVMSHLFSGSRQWTNATVMSRRKGYSNLNPVLFFRNTTVPSQIYLFHSQQKAGAGQSSAQIWALESGADGQNWTEPKPLFTKPGSFCKNRMIMTLNDTAILPIYYAVEGDKNQYSSIVEWMGRDAIDPKSWMEHDFDNTNYLVQPSVVRPTGSNGNPTLIAYFRDLRKQYIYRSVSTDDGKTWSKPSKTTLPNNNSAIQACALTRGNIALVYNPTTSARNPLVISLSEDDGLTWKYTRTLTSSKDMNSEFSYPSITQDTRDGVIHITHTYNRQTIKYYDIPNEDWIKQGDA